jgi:hypothetical protein
MGRIGLGRWTPDLSVDRQKATGEIVETRKGGCRKEIDVEVVLVPAWLAPSLISRIRENVFQ